MFKKILAGYASIAHSLFHFVLLLITAIGTGFLVVYPLWKLADVRPWAYTMLCSVLFAGVAIFFIQSRVRLAYRQDTRRFFLSLARKTTLCVGIVACVVLVFAYQRTAALLVLILTIVLYGFLAFGIADSKKTGESGAAHP